MAGADIRAGRAFVETFLKDKVTGGLDRIERRLKRFSASTKAIGRAMFGTGAIALTPFGLSLAIFTRFEDRMSEVLAKTQATREEFERLRAEARRLGATTSFSAVDVAGAEVFLAQAGFNPDQIINALPDVLDLAKAGGEEVTLPVAADIVTDVSSAFGIADQTKRVGDVLAQTAASANTSIGMMGETFKQAAPAAAAAGQEIEEMAAAAGIAGNNGIKATKAGTDLKNIMIALAKNTEIAGVRTRDANGEMRPLLDIMRDIGRATEGMSGAQRLSLMMEKFGRISGGTAVILSSAGSEIDRLRNKMSESSGAASQMARTMDDNIGGSFRTLISAVQELGLSIGDSVGPALRQMVGQFTTAIRGAAEFVNQNRELVLNVAMAAGGLVALGTALFAVGTAAQVAAFGLSGVTKIVAMAVAPFRLLTVAMKATTGPIATVTTLFGKLLFLPFRLASAGIAGIVGTIKLLPSAVGGLKSLLGVMRLMLSVPIAGLFKGVLLAGALGIDALIAAAASGLGMIPAMLTAALSPMGLLLGGMGALAGAFVVAGGGLPAMGEGFQVLAGMARDAWQGIKASASQAWTGIREVGTQSFNAIVNRIKQGDLQGAFRIAVLGMKAMWAETVAAFAPQWAAFTTAFSRLWGDSVALVSNLWQGFASMFSGAAEFLTSAWNSAVTFITGNTGADGVETTWNDVSASVAQMWNWLVFRAENAWNAIKKAAMDAADGIRKSWGNAVGWIAEKIVEIPGVATLLGVEAYDLKKEVNAITDQRNDAIDTRVAERDKEFQVTEDTQAALERDIGRNIDQERERRNEEDKATREQAIEDAKKAREDARKKLNDEKSPSLVAPDTINGRSLSELKAELEAGQKAAQQRAAAGSAATLRSGEIQSRILQAMRGNDTKKEQEKTNEKLDDLIGKQDEVMDTIEESISFEVIA